MHHTGEAQIQMQHVTCCNKFQSWKQLANFNTLANIQVLKEALALAQDASHRRGTRTRVL
jgi:hypothetical protein